MNVFSKSIPIFVAVQIQLKFCKYEKPIFLSFSNLIPDGIVCAGTRLDAVA